MNLISPDRLFYMAAAEAAAVNKLVAQLVLVVVELVELPAAQMMVVKVIMQHFGEEEVAEQDVSQLYRPVDSQVELDIMEFVFFAILINLNLIYHPLLQHRQIQPVHILLEYMRREMLEMITTLLFSLKL